MVMSPHWGHAGVCLPTFSLPCGQFIHHRKASTLWVESRVQCWEKVQWERPGIMLEVPEWGQVGAYRGALGPQTQTTLCETAGS